MIRPGASRGTGTDARIRRAAPRLVAGALLVAVFWWWSWRPERPVVVARTSFFMLWLGYILTVDGLLEARTGTSPWRRGLPAWIGLFAASVPAWWLFEFFNRFLHNWVYVGRYASTGVARAVFASLAFSTVVPAVLTTAELVAAVAGPARRARGPAIDASPRALAAWVAVGLVLLGGVVAWPRYFFPAVWLGVLFVVDPLLYLLGWPSLTERLRRGDWGPAATLAVGALVCGFFWEMWNVRADPKWIYRVPLDAYGLDATVLARRVFEMPVLGYLGYLPFGLEVFALSSFVHGLAGARGPDAGRLADPAVDPAGPPSAPVDAAGRVGQGARS